MVKNYQKIMDDEYVNAVLKNIQMRVKLQNLKAEPMNEYDNGIEPKQTMEQTLNRTEFLNNTMAQRQKMDENLFKLFQDDEVSINIVYDNIAQSDEDVLFFNSNYNKLYKELSNIIDLDYLDSNYFIAFYERYKQKYSDPKNIIVDEKLLQKDKEEEMKNFNEQMNYDVRQNNNANNNSSMVYDEDNFIMNPEDINEENFNDNVNEDVVNEKIINIEGAKNFLSINPKKYGYYIMVVCQVFLVKEEFFLTNEQSINPDLPVINEKLATDTIRKLFNNLKLLLKYRLKNKQRETYKNKIQPFIKYDINFFYYDQIDASLRHATYEDDYGLSQQDPDGGEVSGLDNFIEYIIYACNKLSLEDYEDFNRQYKEAIDAKLLEIQTDENEEQAKLKYLNKRDIEQRRQYEEYLKQVEEEEKKGRASTILTRSMKKLAEKKKAEAEQKRAEEERLVLERQKFENEMMVSEEKRKKRLDKIDKNKRELDILVGQKPHQFSEGDIIAFNNFEYRVMPQNIAYKYNKKNGGYEPRGALEYKLGTFNKDVVLGWFRAKTLVDPVYLRRDEEINEPAEEVITVPVDETKDGEGLKRNIGVSKILKSLGYEII